MNNKGISLKNMGIYSCIKYEGGYDGILCMFYDGDLTAYPSLTAFLILSVTNNEESVKCFLYLPTCGAGPVVNKWINSISCKSSAWACSHRAWISISGVAHIPCTNTRDLDLMHSTASWGVSHSIGRLPGRALKGSFLKSMMYDRRWRCWMWLVDGSIDEIRECV